MEVFATLMGVSFRGSEAKEIVKRLTTEDGDQLLLEADPFNEYDNHAVKVIHIKSGEHVGFVARENNFEVFQALQNGEDVQVEIVGFRIL